MGRNNVSLFTRKSFLTFNPFFTAILAIFFLNEKMTSRLAIGLTLGISGVAILFYYSPNVDISFTNRAIGDLLIAGAALSWACNTILMKKAMLQWYIFLI